MPAVEVRPLSAQGWRLLGLSPICLSPASSLPNGAPIIGPSQASLEGRKGPPLMVLQH